MKVVLGMEVGLSPGDFVDVDVDGVYERRPRPLCPPHV